MVAENFGEACPASAPFFGYMGAAAALIFANLGAAYGTAKSGVGICSMGVMHPGLIMKCNLLLFLSIPFNICSQQLSPWLWLV